MKDYRTAPVEPEMMHLLFFAETVARDAGKITSDNIARLRSLGFSDRAVLNAAHVAGFFSYIDRAVQALGADTKVSATEPAGEKALSEISACNAMHI